jgi:hypothetical protein
MLPTATDVVCIAAGNGTIDVPNGFTRTRSSCRRSPV